MNLQARKYVLFLLCFAAILFFLESDLLANHPHPPLGPDPLMGENPMPPQSQIDSEKSRELGSTFWIAFHAAAIFGLALLYGLFSYADANRKKLVKYKADHSEDKEEPPKLLTDGELKIALFIFGSLAATLLILASNQFWFSVVWISAFFAYIWHSFPDAITEVFAFLKKKFSSDMPQPKISPDDVKTFKDVGGLEEAIEELSDIISLFKNPEDAKTWDIQPTNGILLIGPPGNGKTLLARAIAGEAGMPFFAYVGAEIGTSYVRSGAQQIKAIFQEAREKAPCVIFIDEIDAVGQRRGFDTSHEFDHALNSLLYEMDGIPSNKRVLVLAATNREDVLDPALLRRFGKKILIPPPDPETREKILRVHTTKKPLAPEADLRDIAHRTAGFNGSALKDLANEAAQLARRRLAASEPDAEKFISMSDFEEGMLRVLMGPARKAIMNEEDRKVVAYHEIGHAIVTAEKGLEVLKKVMLMPRNWSLGLTISQGEERQVHPKPMVLARITALLAGRAAEEIIFGSEEITTGGANDIERAVELARLMICEWGMGKDGPKLFYKPTHSAYSKPFSEHSAASMDEEVGQVIASCYSQAKEIVFEKKELLHDLAGRLMEKTVLDADEILNAIKELK